MNICFSENVKHLRKEKDLTQEALADELGISFQTVSKWERGESYPDITMLPVISSFFGVTVDVLLGTDRVRIEQRVKKYLDLFDNMKLKDALSVMTEYKKAVNEFPNEYPILVRYMELLQIVKGGETKQDHEQISNQMAAFYEKIQKYCTDDAIRIRSKRLMIEHLMHKYQCYGFDKEYLQQAKTIADSLPSMSDSKESVLPDLDFDPKNHDFQKWYENRQRAIEELSYLLQNTIISYCYYDMAFIPEYKIEVIKHLNGIFRMTDSETHPSKNRIHLIYNYGHLGHLYAEIGDIEEAFHYLRLAAEQAVLFDTLPEAERLALLYEREERFRDLSLSKRMYELMTKHYPLSEEFKAKPEFQEILEILK
ncbi:MAG: helix-turn-helix transcriptional regulator [Clostridia bacterium]|nr:helix-turn-helix transcriptional regulator [Clostridia bacterium]